MEYHQSNEQNEENQQEEEPIDIQKYHSALSYINHCHHLVNVDNMKNHAHPIVIPKVPNYLVPFHSESASKHDLQYHLCKNVKIFVEQQRILEIQRRNVCKALKELQ